MHLETLCNWSSCHVNANGRLSTSYWKICESYLSQISQNINRPRKSYAENILIFWWKEVMYYFWCLLILYLIQKFSYLYFFKNFLKSKCSLSPLSPDICIL